MTEVVLLRLNFNGTAPAQPGQPVCMAFHGSAVPKRAEFGMMHDLREELGTAPTLGPDVKLKVASEAKGLSTTAEWLAACSRG